MTLSLILRALRRALPRRRLFWRIALHGLLLLVAVAMAMAAVGLVSGEGSPWWMGIPDRMAQVLAADVGSERLGARLEEMQYISQANLAIYREDGIALALAGPEPPPALTAEEIGALGERAFVHRGAQVHLALPLGQGAYLMVSHMSHNPARAASALLAILAALALTSLPLARAIARPLERLTDTAQRLAQGDLSVRTGLHRQDEVGQLARTMDIMASRVETLIRSERELLANVSHEIRTPLARVRVALELCSEAEGVEEVKAYLEGIGDDVGELEDMVADVLMAARLDLSGEREGMSLRLETLDLFQVVSQAAGRFASAHPDRTLARQLASDLPPLQADPALIRRVLNNLLDNAAKYSGPDHPVELAVWPSGGGLAVEVRDRGIGVAEEDLPRLFEPFFRTERSLAIGASGTGLGLSLCKRIIEAHGGTIMALSRPEGGVAIRFVLGDGLAD